MQVLKVVPQHKEAIMRLARLWLRVGRTQPALQAANCGLASYECDFAMHQLRGDVLTCASFAVSVPLYKT